MAAIEDVVKEMIFLARPIARRRLRDSNQPSDELRLEVSATQITIVRPGRPTVAARRDGGVHAAQPRSDAGHSLPAELAA